MAIRGQSKKLRKSEKGFQGDEKVISNYISRVPPLEVKKQAKWIFHVFYWMSRKAVIREFVFNAFVKKKNTEI